MRVSGFHTLNTAQTCSRGHGMKLFPLKTSPRHFVHNMKRNIALSKFHSLVTWHVPKRVHPYLFITNIYSLSNYRIY